MFIMDKMSLNNVLRIQRERKKREEGTFQKIHDRVKIRIDHSAKYGGTHCYYNIPQLLYGLPSVDLKKCGDFIQKKLKNEGFVVYRLTPTYFLISWEQYAVEEQKDERRRRKEESRNKIKMEKLEDNRREDLMGYLLKSKNE